MKYEATITLSEDAEKVEKLFRPEEKDFRHKRSNYELERKGGGLTFKIRAEDATALRATLASIAKTLKVYEDMKGV